MSELALPARSSPRAYRALCAVVGAGLGAAGLVFVLGAFRSLAPGAPEILPGVPMGPPALYFLAFTGCALLGWGGALVAAAREPTSGVGTWSAVALVAMALYRMAAWAMAESPFPGDLPRIEAALFLVLALGFVWLRPRRSCRGEA